MIRNLGILRVYFNMFYAGLILCNKDHINIFQTRNSFKNYDGQKVQFICIASNQRVSRISITIDFYKSIIALNYMLSINLSFVYDTSCVSLNYDGQ